MEKLQVQDLLKLEDYARERDTMRQRLMVHKRRRRLPIGKHLTLYFEDRQTIQYQIQEMLRTERIFEPEGIQEELDAYNPLIPDGSNWKATCMLEYTDVEERRVRLTQLVGVEDRIWVQVDGHDPVWAIADEDLDRSTAEKTSAVHFLRFELTPPMVQALADGAEVRAGVDHPAYREETVLSAESRAALIADLD